MDTDLQNQGRSDPIHAGSEGQAGITPADESDSADRRVRSTGGHRAVFAIEGILWMISAKWHCQERIYRIRELLCEAFALRSINLA